MKINQIIIRGTEKPTIVEDQSAESLLTISRSFNIVGLSRGKMRDYEVDLKENDLLEFVFEDETKWLCNSDTIGEIFPEAELHTVRSDKSRFRIPHEITAPVNERGAIGKILLKVVNILSKKVVQKSVEKLARELEDKQLDGKIGLFKLTPDFKLLDFQSENADKPYCLLIHGTASTISGSFGDAGNTELMQFLQSDYGDRILGFQHRTLTQNPLQNVRDLVAVLPKKCTLHLITTSRGGLVGEVLSRFCNGDKKLKGFTDSEVEFLKKAYPDKYAESLLSIIDDIKKGLTKRKISIEKFIRIACPAGGTTLASNRLDNFFNILFNVVGVGTGIKINPVFIAFRNLISAVIGTKNNVEILPGLEVQKPNSPFIKVLNGITGLSAGVINNSLVVISGNTGLDFKLRALLVIATRLFFRRRNDLIVDTVSMSLGTQRTGMVQEFFCSDKNINHFKYFENNTTRNAIKQALMFPWEEPLPGFTKRPVVKYDRSDFDLTDIEIDNPLLRLTHHVKAPTIEKPIRVTISQGDLFYAEYPILAGHFKDDAILYAEKQIDWRLNGMLSHYQQLGNYPGNIEEAAKFLTNGSGFSGAIIIGLGSVENLTPSELTKTVEKGVIRYLYFLINNLSVKDSQKDKKTVGISSLLIGTGYGGLPIEDSIRAIILGVYNANVKTKIVYPDNSLGIEHIEFIELYEDKVVNSLFSLDRIAKDETSICKIILDERGINSLLGSRKRIPRDDNKEWWNRLTVTKNEEDKKEISGLKFSASTKSAREEEKSLFTTPALMQGTIDEFSTNNSWTSKRAKAIFEMLIPNDFKDELKRHGNIIWVLDTYTADYPWELIQEGEYTKPICISSGMIRQLKTPDSRHTINKAPKNKALVIADPLLDGFLNQLDGAREEGEEVSRMLKDNHIEVTESFNENNSEIIEKLFGDDYRIIHLSGHGVFHKDASKGSGMVVGKGQYISVREIQQMSTVPEFVFVNCCHLGKTNGVAEEYYQQRYKLAANIGTQLINNGVKCVIAAGWAVNDAAALDFAKVFYRQMIQGECFGEAVRQARTYVYDRYDGINTWGAYQCYGDPYYRFRKPEIEQEEKSYLIGKEAEVDLENLLNSLEVGDLTSVEYLKKLNAISTAVENAKFQKSNPRITELEALLCYELRDYKKACEKFKELMTSGEATFSFSSFEYYHSARAKKSIEEYRKNKKLRKDSLQEIDHVIEDLKFLLLTGQTPESLNILASTYKRRGYLSEDKKSKQEAYEWAAYYYHLSFSKFKKWYALTNSLIFESILILSGKHKWEEKFEIGKRKYQLFSLKNANRELEDQEDFIRKKLEVMNYWDMIATINIKLCTYIINYTVSHTQKYLDDIRENIRELWKKAGSKGKRFAEIEHLECIIDALSISENKQAKDLRVNLEKMKKDLEKLI